VSFYTFSSEPHRHFAHWLLVLVILPVAGLFALGIYLQPLYGDLTRTGFYSEREFGWHEPQEIFPHSQLAFPASQADSGQYEHYYDMVVLGDSFSYKRPESQWQNFFAAATGESVATLYIGKVGLAKILANPIFRRHPPKFLVVESVERRLPIHLKENIRACDRAQFPLSNNNDIERRIFGQTQLKEMLPGITQRVERDTQWQGVKLAYVRGFIWNNLLRKLADKEHTDAIRVEFNRPAPFSSNEKSATLVYADDIEKIKWWRETGMSEMNCRIEAMRNLVEANGYTHFVLMVPPDKLTAYADYLNDSKLSKVSRLSSLADIHPDVMPRLDKTLIEAIHAGEQDVYLPDDTHWGSNGQRIAAETLIEFLSRSAEHRLHRYH